jgi:molecular chaperone HscC
MRQPLERAMRDAKLQPAQLDEIVLVGGASRMPLVARLISRMFGRLPLRHINPDQAIALGTCVAAGMKARDQQLEELILTDVCPYTLGTSVGRRLENGSVQSGLYAPIIHRNSPVPVSREESYWPMQDNQSLLRMDIYQGESPMVENNIRLGRLDIPLQPQASQKGQVNLRFTYDINGLLHVEATVQATGEKHQLILQQNPGLLSEEEIQQRLVALEGIKIHPRDKQENLALLARAERMYEEHVHAREALQNWIVQFRQVLNDQDDLNIREHRRLLSQALDQMESRP